jgi:hypothetical protein
LAVLSGYHGQNATIDLATIFVMPKVPEMADFRDNFAALPCVPQQPAR